MPTVYYSRTWFRYPGAILCTLLAAFALLLGPLFLFGVLKDANGQPATDAGIALSIMALPLCLVAALLWFNVIALRRPLLRICREAIEVNVIGSSALDGVPLVPPIIRVAWLIVSLEGFKKQIAWIPWSTLREVQVTGVPMAHTIVFHGAVVYPTFTGSELTAKIADAIGFADAEFVDPLDDVAGAIRLYHTNPSARESLPSLIVL